MKLTTNFDMRNSNSNLVKELNNLADKREDFYKRLYRYCDDIDYYVNRGWSEKEAKRYIKYWYSKQCQ